MGFPFNQIGNYQFLSIIGYPTGPSQDPLVISRPGVDGTAIFLTGVRGKQFDLETVVDTPNKVLARNLFDQYQLLRGAAPVEIIHNDVSLSYLNCLFQVLAVEPLEIIAVANSTYGLNPPSLGLLRARWTMIAVPISR